MLHLALISVGLAVLIVAVWYWAFLQYNRRRAIGVLRWLESSISSRGQISGVEWLSPSQFRARLRLPGFGFRQPSLCVLLAPREMPVKWAIWRFRRRQETLTFEANLACAPQYAVEIGRTRWTGLTRRWTRNTAEWPIQAVATLFISTQPEWEPEISSRMSTVVSAREFEFLDVSFHTRPPHFSVKFSLQGTLDRPCGEFTIFDSLRELAEGSPTSRM